jgi:hypothetical protein
LARFTRARGHISIEPGRTLLLAKSLLSKKAVFTFQAIRIGTTVAGLASRVTFLAYLIIYIISIIAFQTSSR